MKQSGDRVIARDLVIGKTEGLLTTEAQRHGEKQLQNLTPEARRRGEKSGYLTAETPAYRIGEIANPCHHERHRATEERGKVEGSRASFLIHAASESSHKTSSGLRWHLQNGWKILFSALREIFDESAYDRFLQRTKKPHSAESYRAFMRERESATAQKPRCC